MDYFNYFFSLSDVKYSVLPKKFDGLEIRKVEWNVQSNDPNNPGTAPSGATEENTVSILLVGETGNGKTTWINANINMLLRVKMEDPYRYVLVPDPAFWDPKYCKSCTKWISSYWVPLKDHPKYKWLRIIDTPGFNDTGTLEKTPLDCDKEHMSRLEKFLLSINQLSAIAFVSKANVNKLTPSSSYVLHEVTRLFSVDVKPNLFLFATFADDKKPQVVDLVSDIFPWSSYLTFQNSALFCGPDSRTMFTPLFWEMCKRGAEAFFDLVYKVKPVSLLDVADPDKRIAVYDIKYEAGKPKPTHRVIRLRQACQMELQNSNIEIKRQVVISTNLKSEIDFVQVHAKQINAIGSYKITKSVPVAKKTPTNNFTTTCITCENSCHRDCVYRDDGQKEHCCAMRGGKCTQCKRQCDWFTHRNLPYLIDWEVKVEEEVIQEKKSMHDQHAQKKKFAEKRVAELEGELDKSKKLVEAHFRNAKKAFQQLKELALKATNHSFVDHVNLLIENEKDQLAPGWEQRVNSLNEYRELAKKWDELDAEEKKK